MIWNYFPLYYISHNLVTGTKGICFVDQCYLRQSLSSIRTWQTHPNDFYCIPLARNVVFSSVLLCCCRVKHARFRDIRLQLALTSWHHSKKYATKRVRTSLSLLSTPGIWYSLKANKHYYSFFSRYLFSTNFFAKYRVSQEEWGSVPYVKIYRYNPKHLYTKLNGYGDNGQRSLKLWQLLHTYWLPNSY